LPRRCASGEDSGEVALLFAILTGTVLTALRVPYRYYRYQFSWVPFASIVGYGVVVAVGAGAGWLGNRLAVAIDWQPDVGPWLSGLAYGSVGVALVRADFSHLPKPEIGPAISVFSVISTWFSGQVDTEREKKIPAWLRSLDSPPLCEYVQMLLVGRFGRDSAYSEAERTQVAAEIESALLVLLDPDQKAGEAAKMTARTLLIGYGESWVVKYHAYRESAG
jgi:hypothetical protein